MPAEPEGATPDLRIADGIYWVRALEKVEYSGPVTEVPQIIFEGTIYEGPGTVSGEDGIGMALKLLEDSPTTQFWANEGIDLGLSRRRYVLLRVQDNRLKSSWR